MHKLTHKLKELDVRRIAFSFVVLAYLGWLVIINTLMFLPALGLLPDNALSAMGHFGDFTSTGDTHNLIHELVFAFIVGTAAAGLLSQLWRPKENFAGQLVALIAWGAMILTAAFTNNWVPQPLFIIFGGLTLLSTILHPALLRQTVSDGQAGRGLFNWFSAARISRTLLALVIIAALPLTMFAFTNINLQLAGGGGAGLFGAHSVNSGQAHNPPAFHGGETDQNLSADEEATLRQDSPRETSGQAGQAHDQEHITVGHYRNMAVFSFIIILVGLLASFRPKGWRFTAWVAGFLPILLGLASVVLPNAESSLGVAWGLAATAWGVVFIAAAEFIRHSGKTSQPA